MVQKTITARHFDLTPEMRDKAEQEIEGLTRYFENIISAEMVLDTERHRKVAELKVKVYNHVMAGTGDTDDMYNSISVAVDKVKGQLKKYKGKLKDKRPDEINETVTQATRPSIDEDSVDQ